MALHLKRLDHHAAERVEVGLARRGRPPSKPDAALWLRLDETQQFHPLVADFDVDGYFGHERHAITARHHLHDGRKTGSAEAAIGVGAPGTIGKRLRAQTMAFFEQDQLARIDVARRYAGALL